MHNYGASRAVIRELCKTSEGRHELAKAQQKLVLQALRKMRRDKNANAKQKAGIDKVIAIQIRTGMRYLPKGCPQ
jgi:hypothetical protein